MAQGQIVRYDRDIKSQVGAFVVAKEAAVDIVNVTGKYVEPSTWEIFANAQIRLSEIQQRRFNVLDRTQEALKIAVQEQEDLQFLALVNTATAANPHFLNQHNHWHKYPNCRSP